MLSIVGSYQYNNILSQNEYAAKYIQYRKGVRNITIKNLKINYFKIKNRHVKHKF